jgi:DNA replication and repair protein RecF
MSELGVAMAMARSEVVRLLSALIDDSQAESPFPGSKCQA